MRVFTYATASRSVSQSLLYQPAAAVQFYVSYYAILFRRSRRDLVRPGLVRPAHQPTDVPPHNRSVRCSPITTTLQPPTKSTTAFHRNPPLSKNFLRVQWRIHAVSLRLDNPPRGTRKAMGTTPPSQRSSPPLDRPQTKFCPVCILSLIHI